LGQTSWPRTTAPFPQPHSRAPKPAGMAQLARAGSVCAGLQQQQQLLAPKGWPPGWAHRRVTPGGAARAGVPLPPKPCALKTTGACERCSPALQLIAFCAAVRPRCKPAGALRSQPGAALSPALRSQPGAAHRPHLGHGCDGSNPCNAAFWMSRLLCSLRDSEDHKEWGLKGAHFLVHGIIPGGPALEACSGFRV
jgi:hypothetical protein